MELDVSELNNNNNNNNMALLQKRIEVAVRLDRVLRSTVVTVRFSKITAFKTLSRLSSHLRAHTLVCEPDKENAWSLMFQNSTTTTTTTTTTGRCYKSELKWLCDQQRQRHTSVRFTVCTTRTSVASHGLPPQISLTSTGQLERS